MLVGASCRTAGMTLFEVLVAMAIFLIGIVGILAALPTGMKAAEYVILQDASVHLSRSKFGEFRRDRVNPPVDLLEGSTYLLNWQEPLNSTGDGWRDFSHNAATLPKASKVSDGATYAYQYFEDIDRFEWKVDQDFLKSVPAGAGTNPAAINGYLFPDKNGKDIGLYRVTLLIRLKGTAQETRFTQYMMDYGRTPSVDATP